MLNFENMVPVLRRILIPAFSLMLTFGLPGCNESRVTLAPVSGVVRFDGNPLANARVIFEPQAARPSVGYTDAKGNFVLEHSPGRLGALVGQHRVRITMDNSEPGLNEEGSNEGARFGLPAIYNTKSELEQEVKAGANVFTFDLNSDAQR